MTSKNRSAVPRQTAFGVLAAMVIALAAAAAPARAQKYEHPLAAWGTPQDTVVARVRAMGFRITGNRNNQLMQFDSQTVRLTLRFLDARLVGFEEGYPVSSDAEMRRRYSSLADSLQRTFGSRGTQIAGSRRWENRATGEAVYLITGPGESVERMLPEHRFVSIQRRGPLHDEWWTRFSETLNRPPVVTQADSMSPREVRRRAYARSAELRFPNLMDRLDSPGSSRPVMANADEVRKATVAGYPEALTEAGAGHRVVLIFVVDVDGRVVDPEVLESTGEAAASAALGAIRAARFLPARAGGSYRPALVMLPIDFGGGQ
jgi:TonB family protein